MGKPKLLTARAENLVERCLACATTEEYRLLMTSMQKSGNFSPEEERISILTYPNLVHQFNFCQQVPQNNNQQNWISFVASPARYRFRPCNEDEGEDEEEELWIGIHAAIPKQLRRPDVDLLIVLDISASMAAPLNSSDPSISKLQAAASALAHLLDSVTLNDQVGLLVFSEGIVVKRPIFPLRDASQVRILQWTIAALTPSQGKSDLVAALHYGFNLFRTKNMVAGPNPTRHAQKTMLIITAADDESCNLQAGFKVAQTLSDTMTMLNGSGIFVKVGTDLHESTVTNISVAPHCRYLSAASIQDLKTAVCDEFRHSVAPLVKDIDIRVGCFSPFQIVEAHGAPEFKRARLPTQCLSISSEYNFGRSLGGMYLFKLAKKPGQKENDNLKISVKFFDPRAGCDYTQVVFSSPASYASGSSNNNDVRKALAILDLVKGHNAYVLESSSEKQHVEPLEQLLTWFLQEMAQVCDDSVLPSKENYPLVQIMQHCIDLEKKKLPPSVSPCLKITPKRIKFFKAAVTTFSPPSPVNLSDYCWKENSPQLPKRCVNPVICKVLGSVSVIGQKKPIIKIEIEKEQQQQEEEEEEDSSTLKKKENNQENLEKETQKIDEEVDGDDDDGGGQWRSVPKKYVRKNRAPISCASIAAATSASCEKINNNNKNQSSAQVVKQTWKRMGKKQSKK